MPNNNKANSQRRRRNARRQRPQMRYPKIMNQPVTSPQNQLQAATNRSLSLAALAESTLIRRNKPSKRRNNRQRTKKASNIHSCVIHYASALADPVNTPAGACIPYGFPLPSQRCKEFIRGTLALGTTGQGFLLANPVISNNAAAVLTTTNTSVGTASTVLGSFTGLVTSFIPNLPYSNSQLNSVIAPMEGRMVSCGIRVRYSGTENNRNGTQYGYEDPNHATLGSSTPNNLLVNPQMRAQRPQPDGSWFEVFSSGPVANSEVTFAAQSAFPNPSYLLIYINGLAGDTYDWEYYIHVEYAGVIATGTIPTHLDTNGYAAVTEAAKNTALTQPLSSNVSKAMFEVLTKTLSSTIPAVLNIDSSTLSTVLSPVLMTTLKNVAPTLATLL